MRKTQAGQAFILVLIVLAIGAVLVVPSLRLTSTALMGTPIVERQLKGLYAADAAQEYILWMLYDVTWRTENLSTENLEFSFRFNVCDVPVSASVVMRAMPGQGGMVLATDDVIKPTKTVVVEGHPEWSNPDGSVLVPNGYPGPYTYIIKLEQLSTDNSKGLDSVYDVLPKGLNYDVNYGSWLRIDGGEWTQDIGEPDIYTTASTQRLRWPASGFFDEEMRYFDIRQVKEIKFQATGSLANDTISYNWVLLNVEDVDTLSGPIAAIKLGAGTKPAGGLIAVTKTSNPKFIQPGVPTPIEYTISITNLETQTDQITEIIDYLPPEFLYLGPTSSVTSEDPQITFDAGLGRYKLLWTQYEFPSDNAISIASGATVTLTFWAEATKDVSGTYYNEATAVDVFPISSIFQPSDMSVTAEDFNVTYSWNTGEVMVPAYDTSSEAEGVTIDANMALIELGGITITSWGVR